MLLMNSIRRLHQQSTFTKCPLLFLCIIITGGCVGGSDDRTPLSYSSSSTLSSSRISSAMPSSSSSQAGTDSSGGGTISTNILFDDSDYNNSTQMMTNGWYVRSGSGGPGAAGVNWSRDYVSFTTDPDNSEIDFEYLANGGWGQTHHVPHHMGKPTSLPLAC